MLIRFGYVAMSVKLENCSPSKTITVKNLEKIAEPEARLNRLRRITAENLQNLTRLLHYNVAHRIQVFRFTSKLVPLATHPLAQGWDYTADFADALARIGEIVRANKLRVSAHPDHFTLLNSPRPEVLAASLLDLAYHDRMFNAMGLPDAEMVMHIGGMYGSRDKSIERFRGNFLLLPVGIRRRLLLENDDKSFTAGDVLGLCRELGIPMVLDVHHHRCLDGGEDISKLLAPVFDTWGDRRPKVHFSSPKSPQNCRAHADDIDLAEFRRFLTAAREVERNFDVMIEAKNKDAALFKLMQGLVDMPGVQPAGAAAVTVQ